MSKQEINIRTHTDADGTVNLDLPLGIVDQDIDLTVSYSTPAKNNQTDQELAEIIAQAKPASDLSEYCGVIELPVEPLEFQQSIRNEWQ
ncbi:MAG: hypothetical protein AAGK10_19675 [Cyanobacteria bacterium J06555_3]